MESRMDISERMLLTPASPGSCFTEDVMQGHSCVCMCTHTARTWEKHVRNQSHKSQLGWWVSFNHIGFPCFEAFRGLKRYLWRLSFQIPSTWKCSYSFCFISRSQHWHPYKCSKLLSILRILVEGAVSVFGKGSQDCAVDNYWIQVVQRDISDK